MAPHSTRRGARFQFILAAALLISHVAAPAIAADMTPTAEPGERSRVLYINSYNRGYTWSDAIETSLTEELNASGRRIDISVEYLDSRRFPGHSHDSALADALEIKYRHSHHDLVIVSDNDAFTFAMKYRDKLFPGVPIVFCGYNSFRPEVLNGIANVTGVNEEVDQFGTITLALGIHRSTDTLVFIGSTYTPTSARNLEFAEKSVLPAYRDRYQIVLLKDLTMQAVTQRLAALGSRSLVFNIGGPADFDEYIHVSEYARHIAAASPVPVYTFWDFYLNSGAMGGRVITGSDQGRAAASLALKILAGTPADAVPVIMTTPTTTMFDFNAMKRFRLSESDLPQGSIVINRPEIFYEKYRYYVWSAAAIFVLLSSLVMVLALLLRRSRRLEEQVRTNERRFRVLVEHAPEAIIVYDADKGRIVDANANASRLTGYRHEELLGLDPALLYLPSQSDNDPLPVSIRANTDRALAGEQLVFERTMRTADGEEVPCEVRLVRLPSDRSRLIRGSYVDISSRKQADEALHKRQAKIESIFRGAPVGIGEVADQTFTLVNDRFCELIGYSVEELVGQKTRVVYFSDEHRDKVHQDILAQVSKKGFAAIETTLRRKDGRAVDVIFGIAPISPVVVTEDSAFTFTVMDITERHAAAKSLKDAFGKLRLLSARLLNAQESERRAIANELHDEIGQALTAVTLKLHSLARQISAGTATKADVESCMDITNAALGQVRNLSLNLRPPQLELMGLEAALNWLLTTRTETGALATHLNARLDAGGRSPQVDITCFRIVQEALTNAIRHAGARNLWVDATQEQDFVKLRIRDDGSGFDPDAARAKAIHGGSVGLLSMEERSVLMGGSFEVISQPGAGATICATIPLVQEPVASASGGGDAR